MRKLVVLLCGVLIMLSLALSGCAKKESPIYAKPSETIQKTSVSEQQLELLKKVTHAEVWDYGRNWDEDAENDGIAVYIRFLDKNEEIVKFKGVKIPIEIEIYSLDEDRDVKALIYKGNATITSWRDVSMGGSGIRIPFEDMNFTDIDKAKEGIHYRIFIKAKMPDGRVIEAARDGNTKWWFKLS